MLTKIFLFCVVLTFSVVTGNPLLQAIISQSCPICEQNALKNQIQNLLLQQTSNFLPYPQPYMNQNPLNENCMQPVTLPNKPSCAMCPKNTQNHNFEVPYQQQQIMNHPPPVCPQPNLQTPKDQAIPGPLNKLLSNPTLRTILDPNTRLYNQNGDEVSRNRAFNTATPNIINNYIIVPPELLLEDSQMRLKTDKKTPEERRKRNRSNDANSNRKPKPESDSTDSSKRPVNTERVVDNNKGVKENITNVEEHKSKRRQRNRNPDVKVKLVSENATQEISKTTLQEDVKDKDSKQVIKSTLFSQNLDEKVQKEKRAESPKTIESPKEIINQKVEDIRLTQNLKKNNRTEKEYIQQRKDPIHENTTEKLKGKNTHPTSKKVSKVTPRRNPIEEAIIKEFKKKFPNIPEDLVIKLLEYMKRQLSNQNFGAPAFYYPQFPLSYDQLFTNQFANMPTFGAPLQNIKSAPLTRKSPVDNQNAPSRNRSSERRKNRRNKNRRKKPEKSTTPENCDISSTVKSTPAIEVTTTVENELETTSISTTTTTEKPTTVEDKTEPTSIVIEVLSDTAIPVQTVITESISKSTDISRDGEVKVPELGSEHIVPTIYDNELIDEYPEFTGDHQYYSNEDFSFIRIDDDRYHYTTDKNFRLEELNRERRTFDKNDNNKRRPLNRYVLRLKNRDRHRLNQQDRISKYRIAGTTTKPNLESIERPRVKIRLVTNPLTESEESNTVKPTSTTEEVIQFRTPPTLDKIDFETKQINKKNFYDDDYKVSSYSDIKTPQYSSSKNNEKAKQKPVPKIETVSANSKVKVYKPEEPIPVIDTVSADSKVAVYKPQENVKEDIWPSEDFSEYSQTNNNYDETQIVLAKSVKQ